MNPKKIKNLGVNPSSSNHKRHLHLVISPQSPKYTSRRMRKNFSWRWGLLVIFLSLLGYSWMIGQTYNSHSTIKHPAAASNLLIKSFRQDGMEGYFLNKARLKDTLRQQLQQPESSDLYKTAYQFSFYFFPDLLPETVFERSESITLFTPLIDQIEKHPKSKRAEQSLRDLTSEIWNFENIDRDAPRISNAGEHVLQLLDVLAKMESE